MSTLLATLLGMGHMSLALRNSSRVWDTPLTDDGYYALTIARNLGTGHGLTYNEGPSNGFQPLWVLAIAPVYHLVGGDRIAGLRIVAAVAAALFIATAFLLGRLAGMMTATMSAPSSLVAVLFLGSGLLYRQYFNGLETGLYLFLLSATWWLYARQNRTMRWVIAFGLMLGLVVLTRIDATLLVVVVVASFARDALRSRRPWWHAATVAGISVLVSTPWWVYNVMYFGSVMPTSGWSQLDIRGSWERIAYVAQAISWNAVPGLYVPERLDHPALIASRIGLLAACVLLVGKHSASSTAAPAENHSSEFARLSVWFFLALVLVYGVGLDAVFFFHRYFAPVSLVSTIAIAEGVSAAARRWPQARPITTIVPVTAAVMTVTLIVVAHTGAAGSTNTYAAYNEQLALVQQLVPPGARVGAAQTGLLGYFRNNVVNLDGKVNAEALAFRNDMSAYLTRACVNYFVDWPVFVEQYLGPNASAAGWRLVAQRGSFQLWRRRPASSCEAALQGAHKITHVTMAQSPQYDQ